MSGGADETAVTDFEADLEALESKVQTLQRGTVSLDEALRTFEEGVALYRRGSAALRRGGGPPPPRGRGAVRDRPCTPERVLLAHPLHEPGHVPLLVQLVVAFRR